MVPTSGERVTEALGQHVSAQLGYRRHIDEILATARRESEEIRRTGSRLSGLRSARRTWRALREQQDARPSFDSTPVVELVAEARGTDAESADRALYRAAWQLELLAGVHWQPFDVEVAPLADDELRHVAHLLAEGLLEPDDGPVHARLRRAQALWLALQRGELLAIKPGWVMLSPRRSIDRTRRREALMRLPEARRELLQEWRRILVAA